MALRVRAMTGEEQAAVKRVAHSRTEPARRVERARIIWLVHRHTSSEGWSTAGATTDRPLWQTPHDGCG